MKEKPPKHLSDEAKMLFDRYCAEYPFQTQASFDVLVRGLEAYDTMNEARAEVEKHGLMIPDRFGQLRKNPCCSIERDARAQMLQAIRMLNVDLFCEVKK